jgi:hypothetical protein
MGDGADPSEFLLELRDNRDQDMTDRGQASRAELVEGVLRCVPVGDFHVDYVNGRNAAPEERNVIVFDTGRTGNENVAISEP